MKRAIVLMMAFAFVLSFAAPIMASEMPAPVDKLGHGFMDVIKSPLELYYVPKDEMDSADHKAVGFFKGILKAPFHVVKKAGGGLIDIVTFPIK